MDSTACYYMKLLLRTLPFFVLAVLLLGLFVLPIATYAQISGTTDAQQAQLQKEYDALQTEIGQWQQVLDDTRKKAGTITGDISALSAKIKEAELMIKAKNIAISQLGTQISEKNKKIGTLDTKITKGKESLAQLLRKTNEIDSYSLVEMVLANKNISEFFLDLDSYDSIKKAMREHFTVVREAKASTEAEKAQLDAKKNQEADAKYVVETRKKTIAQSEAEKKKLLSITKNEEKQYQTVLADRQKKAAQIRAALFRLRDSAGISFGDALVYANNASSKTGVRAALILAILTQESDLGKNQGSCIVTDLATGNGVGKNTGNPFEQIMKAPRDTVPFASITARLGRDPKITPVSCPPAAKYTAGRGFGGGMGPSQFIPSTWETLKNELAPLVGVSADQVDPWNPEHSFIATAMYMSDRGAAGGGFSAERNAACKYYSGASCQPGRKPANVFYGDQVMEKAASIQTNIDFLKGI